jgi:hypothetical protein
MATSPPQWVWSAEYQNYYYVTYGQGIIISLTEPALRPGVVRTELTVMRQPSSLPVGSEKPTM